MNIETADAQRENLSLSVFVPTHILTDWTDPDNPRAQTVMALDSYDAEGEPDGYILYTETEWFADDLADYSADLDGEVRFQGQRGPYSLRYSPAPPRSVEDWREKWED